MGAVLHCRVCKGCLVHHHHGHSHGCGNGAHSHTPSRGHHGSDDELLPTSTASVNGYRPVPTEGRSDVQLLVNGSEDDVDDQQSTDSTVQHTYKTTNVNIRAAMVHVIGDLIQSFGVFTAAVIVLVKVCCTATTAAYCLLSIVTSVNDSQSGIVCGCSVSLLITSLVSRYTSQYILKVVAGRASDIKIPWGAWQGLLLLSSVWLLHTVTGVSQREPVINQRTRQIQK